MAFDSLRLTSFLMGDGSVAARLSSSSLLANTEENIKICSQPNTEAEIMVCMWLGEIYYCCSLTSLPGPAWVLLSYVLHTIMSGSVCVSA